MAPAWIAFGVVSGTQTVVGMKAEGMHHAWTALFLMQSLSWSFWAITTPVVAFVVQKYPPSRKLPALGWAAHIAAFIAISTCRTAWGAFLESTLKPWSMDAYSVSWRQVLAGLWLSTLPIDLIVYVAVAAISHGLKTRRDLARHELEMAQMNARYFEAQLSGLRRQLEPHFLFNTLNGISGLIRDHRSPAALEAIAKLGDLLRHSLDSPGHEVTLGEELDFVHQYLDLQEMRFGARLRVCVSVPEGILQARVPSLVLQEIVANAIQHGIGKKEQGGTISISAASVEESLVLQVANDGPLLSEEYRPCASSEKIQDGKSGIGLSNLRARLKGLYGASARFALENRPDGGVEARVTLPFRHA